MGDVSEDSLLIVGGERRQRGRPRVAEQMEPVMTRLPLPLYDKLAELSQQRGESLSSVVRSLLTLRISRNHQTSR